MTNHIRIPDGRDAEMLTLADEFEAGTTKAVATGYEELGPEFQRKRKLIVDALRSAALPKQADPSREELAKAIYETGAEPGNDACTWAAAKYPFGFSLDEMDVESFFNVRGWLQKAVETQGAKMVGGGVGMGQADIDIDLDGCRYNISIKPLPKAKP